MAVVRGGRRGDRLESYNVDIVKGRAGVSPVVAGPRLALPYGAGRCGDRPYRVVGLCTLHEGR